MNDNSRQADRRPVDVWGFYRTPNGGKRDVLIKDLSETGCRFFDKFSGLAANDELRLKIEQLGPFEATVRWNEAGYVGVQFERTLYGPIFEHICLKLAR